MNSNNMPFDKMNSNNMPFDKMDSQVTCYWKSHSYL